MSAPTTVFATALFVGSRMMAIGWIFNTKQEALAWAAAATAKELPAVYGDKELNRWAVFERNVGAANIDTTGSFIPAGSAQTLTEVSQ
jgi:hypothetical protein